MLLCSSKIPVCETCTPEVFVREAIKWVLGSRNYRFAPFSWDGRPEFSCTGGKCEVFQVGLFNENKICAVHFSSQDNHHIKWTTDFILDTEEHLLAFQLHREAPIEAELLQARFDLPALVRKLIEAGFCALDNGLPVDNKPVRLHKSDVGWVSELMLHQRGYQLPVVYVSCEYNGHAVLNPIMLAEKLNGVAHVLFETDKSTSRALRDRTGGINPRGGEIEIYYPSGSRKIQPAQLPETNAQKVRAIVNMIFGHLVQLRVEDKFLWSQLQANKLRSQLNLAMSTREEASKEYQELEGAYEDILEEKESTILRLTDQLNTANAAVSNLEAILSATPKGDVPALVMGEEKDLYAGEHLSILVELLRRELEQTKGHRPRRHDVIQSLLDANSCEDAVAKKRGEVKKCLNGYLKMTATTRRELERIGFRLWDGGKHYKLTYGKEGRYTATLCKTGSDYRSSQNTSHDVSNTFF